MRYVFTYCLGVWLAGCAPAAPPAPAGPQIPPDAPTIRLAAEVRALFEAYLREPIGAVFFASRDGRGGIYFHCLFHPCDEVREEELRARCFAAGIADCITYARGRTIVVRTE